VYCPSCGHDNQSDIKFCTRCGTNLAVVADALAGKPVGAPDIDDRMTKLLTKYYDGRRSTAVGAVSLGIGLLMVIAILAAGLNQDNLPLPALLLVGLSACALVYGAIAVIAGVAEWVQSSSEMNALGYSAPATIAQARQLNLRSSSAEQPGRSQAEYATDPISYPPNVTEQTTRQLDEHSFSPHPKESNRTN
jgi:zinc ribbon protein